MPVRFEIRADNEAVSRLVKTGDVVGRHAGAEHDGQTTVRFGFAYICKTWRQAGLAATDDDRIAAHELDGRSRRAETYIGRDGVRRMFLLHVRPNLHLLI